MELRNKTDLTLDLQINFSKKLFWNSNRKMIIIIEVILLAVIVLVSTVYQDKLWLAIVAGILAILIPLFLKYFINKTTKKVLEESQEKEGSLNASMDYIFHEDKMEIKLFVNNYSSMMTYNYDQFLQIVETSDVFAFILENNQAFYVNKKGFYEGQSETLSSLVKNQITYKKI